MTDNKRVERLELIVKRLMRRAHKQVVALVTPYPISSSSFGEDVHGSVLRYMFPCAGTIVKGMICLGAKPKNIVSFDVKVFNNERSEARGFLVLKKSTSMDLQIPIRAGDCLDISLQPTADEKVTEVWVSFLWRPTTNDVEVKSYLIEELENDILKEEEQLLIDSQLSGDSG